MERVLSNKLVTYMAARNIAMFLELQYDDPSIKGELKGFVDGYIFPEPDVLEWLTVHARQAITVLCLDLTRDEEKMRDIETLRLWVECLENSDDPYHPCFEKMAPELLKELDEAERDDLIKLLGYIEYALDKGNELGGDL